MTKTATQPQGTFLSEKSAAAVSGLVSEDESVLPDDCELVLVADDERIVASLLQARVAFLPSADVTVTMAFLPPVVP